MPSMTHQIAYRGEDRNGALRVASTCAGLAMVPMTLGLGATTFVVFESVFNRNVGVVAGVAFAIVAFSFLYALGLILRIGHKGRMPLSEKQTSLKNKIEQLLTEARVIIPGAQALLGFQFIVVFVRSLPSCRMGQNHPCRRAGGHRLVDRFVDDASNAAPDRLRWRKQPRFLPDRLDARCGSCFPAGYRYRRGHLRSWVQDNGRRGIRCNEWVHILADPRHVMVLLSALVAPCQRRPLLRPWAS